MHSRKFLTGLILSAVSAAAIMTVDASIVSAQAQMSAMSCEDLWYSRNQIFAREGYCFKTERGRAVFGAGCFPPYGRLSPAEQDQVNAYQYWERTKGCPQ